MRGTTSRRVGFADGGKGRTTLVVALALVISACGAPDGPAVDDDPPGDAEPSGEDDPTEPEPPVDDPTADVPTDPQAADEDQPPDDDEPDDQVEPTEDDEVAAECDDLEGRPYDPPAEEQPAADPDITSAEAVPDIEPLDDEEWDEDGPSPTPMHRAQAWAMEEAPEHFGGVWLDQSEGGVSVVGFTQDVESYAEEVWSRFSEHLWVVRTDNSWDELTALNDEIHERETGEAGSGAIHMMGQTPTISRVTLTLVDPDDDRLRELSDRYGADRICFRILGGSSEDEG